MSLEKRHQIRERSSSEMHGRHERERVDDSPTPISRAVDVLANLFIRGPRNPEATCVRTDRAIDVGDARLSQLDPPDHSAKSPIDTRCRGNHPTMIVALRR
jgi:hypothetical protein